MACCFQLFTVTVFLLATRAEGQCSTRDIRLAGGSVPNEGRVEVCIDGKWGTVCDGQWDSTDAGVVCRQLGYTPIGTVANGTSRFGTGNGPIFVDNFGCFGREEWLYDCNFTSAHNCNRAATVVCPTQCTEGDIRVMDGTTRYEGRVEVCVGEVWGTVCDNGFHSVDAGVACHQLGFSRIDPTVVIGKTFPQGSENMPLARNWIACSGNEVRLTDCQYSDVTCFHYEDVGIDCEPNVVCEEGDLRLANGTSNSGRVEICILEVWSSLCSNPWTALNTKVVCRQLGFRSSGLGTITTVPGNTDDRIHQVGFACTGDENRLFSCNQSALTSVCSHSDDLTIQCSNEMLCEEEAIRLAGGSDLSGRVEVCVTGNWGTVCNDYWDNRDSRVACRQLGFSGVNARRSSKRRNGSGPIHMDDVRCTGFELRLLSCPYDDVTDDCSHYEDILVDCQPLVCADGDLRLVGGLSEYEGRLEMCYNEVWGTVCDGFWNQRASEVACRQRFNISDNVVILRSGHFSASSSAPILLDKVVCTGSESTLLDCIHQPIGVHYCSHNNAVNLRCGQCREYDVRLVDGAGYNEGRVEVCANGRWGTVCDDDWGDYDARVVCRQLGLPTSESVAVIGRTFPTNPSLPIVMDNVQCTGIETSLGNCIYLASNELRMCSHDKDAGVRCPSALPPPPLKVFVASATDTTLQLSWSPPFSLSNPSQFSPVTGYTVVCTSVLAPRRSENTQNNAVLSLTVNGLQPFTGYTCCVNAESVTGAGLSSCAMRQTRQAPPSDPPQSVSGVPTSPTTITLTWQPPSAPNGVISEYRINITEQDTSRSWQLTSQSLVKQITGLHPYYIYSVGMTAVTVGEGPYSSYVEIQTYQDVPTAAPTNVISPAKTNTSITLTWQLPPASHHNGILTYHEIRVYEHSIGTITRVKVPLPALSHTVEELHPQSMYGMAIAAATVNGTGPFSSDILVKTGLVPVQQLVVIAAPRSLHISWKLPTDLNRNEIINYSVNVTLLDGSTGIVIVTNSTNVTVGSLHPNSLYWCSVAARNSAGLGPSTTVLERTLSEISAPTLGEVKRISASKIRVRWQPSTQVNRDDPIANYTVKYYPVSPDGWVHKSVEDLLHFISTNETEVVIQDLNPVLNYSVSVAANTVAGRGNYSNEVSVGLSENSFFQIFLSAHGTIDCKQWVLYHIETKLESLGDSFIMDVNSICKCNFTSEFVLFKQPHCNAAHPDWLILWGRIIGTDTSSSTNILKILASLVKVESSYVVEGVHFTKIKHCSVFLQGESPSCETEEVKGEDSPESFTNIITIVVVVLALLILVVVCSATLAVCKKKTIVRKLRFSRSDPVSASNMAVINSSMGVESKLDDDSCKDTSDSQAIYDTILDPTPFLLNRKCLPKPPVQGINLSLPNAYASTHKTKQGTSPYPSNSSSHYEELMLMSSETPGPVYAVLQAGPQSGKSRCFEQAQCDGQDKGGGKGVGEGVVEESGYQGLLHVKKDETEYASLMKKP